MSYPLAADTDSSARPAALASTRHHVHMARGADDADATTTRSSRARRATSCHGPRRRHRLAERPAGRGGTLPPPAAHTRLSDSAHPPAGPADGVALTKDPGAPPPGAPGSSSGPRARRWRPSTRSQKPTAIPGWLWRQLREDPAHAAEHMALAAHQIHGPWAVKWLERKRRRFRHHPRSLADVAKREHANVVRLTGAATGVGGVTTAMPGLAALVWMQTRLVFATAASYGHDPRRPAARRRAARHPGAVPRRRVRAARARRRRHVGRTGLHLARSSRARSCCFARLLAMAGKYGAKKLMVKGIPVAVDPAQRGRQRVASCARSAGARASTTRQAARPARGRLSAAGGRSGAAVDRDVRAARGRRRIGHEEPDDRGDLVRA